VQAAAAAVCVAQVRLDLEETPGQQVLREPQVLLAVLALQGNRGRLVQREQLDSQDPALKDNQDRLDELDSPDIQEALGTPEQQVNIKGLIPFYTSNPAYTLFQNKTRHLTFSCNFGKCKPIFKILPLAAFREYVVCKKL